MAAELGLFQALADELGGVADGLDGQGGVLLHLDAELFFKSGDEFDGLR